MAFRATLRDPDGFGHIGWMIRPVGSSVPRRAVRPPGFSIAVILGIGRVVQ
jgi:hypothetical protein